MYNNNKIIFKISIITRVNYKHYKIFLNILFNYFKLSTFNIYHQQELEFLICKNRKIEKLLLHYIIKYNVTNIFLSLQIKNSNS